MNPEDIQQQFDDLSQRMDDSDTAQQDFSDNLDSSLTDLQTTIDDHSTTLDDLNNTAGQLQFPLTQDTIDLINEVIKNYSANLQLSGVVTTDNSGNATITNANILATSVIVVTPEQGGTGYYVAACSAGHASIASSGAAYQMCIFNYIIII